MNITFEQMVRERAYEIWMSAGMSDGQAHEHWVIAEQAVASEIGEMAPITAPVKGTSVKKAAAAKKPAAPKKAAAPKAPAKRAPTKIASKAMAAPATH